MVHELKTWPEYFEAIFIGIKTFDVRKDDRDFQAGDELVLKEYDPETKTYTGREMREIVTYILRGPAFGIQDGYVVMAIGRISNHNQWGL